MLQVLHEILQLHLIVSVRRVFVIKILLLGFFARRDILLILLLFLCQRLSLRFLLLLFVGLLLMVLLFFLASLTNQERHSVIVSHPLDLRMLVSTRLLELLQDLQGRWDVDLVLSVLSDPPGERNSELLPDHSLRRFREVPRYFVPEEVEIGLVFLELLPDKVQLVSQLIVLLGNLEEVITADRFNVANGARLELLQELRIVAHEAVRAEAGSL